MIILCWAKTHCLKIRREGSRMCIRNDGVWYGEALHWFSKKYTQKSEKTTYIWGQDSQAGSK